MKKYLTPLDDLFEILEIFEEASDYPNIKKDNKKAGDCRDRKKDKEDYDERIEELILGYASEYGLTYDQAEYLAYCGLSDDEFDDLCESMQEDWSDYEDLDEEMEELQDDDKNHVEVVKEEGKGWSMADLFPNLVL